MPVADLPYRVARLADEGQYAYLARPVVRAVKTEPEEPTAKKVRVPTAKLRVLRNVTLCDGPSLWDSIAAKRATTSDTPPAEPYAFYVNLRLFATRSMVEDYLSGPEVASYCKASGTAPPVLNDADPVIGESDYLEAKSVAITKDEYAKMVRTRDGSLSLENLEELVCRLQGVDSLEDLGAPKRTRRKKSAPPPAPPPSPVTVVETEGSDHEEASDRPAVVVEVKAKTIKKKTRTTLRDQFALVQNTPSRVIDVSGYGDTMQHQRGKILDRVRHEERISKCTSLPDLFPVISDNVPAFERAMTALGPRYSQRVAEFKVLHV